MKNRNLKALSTMLGISILLSGVGSVYAEDNTSKTLDLTDSFLAFDVEKYLKEGKATAEEILGDMDLNQMFTLQLGSSALTIQVPNTYEEGYKTEEDIEDGQVAYYFSEELDMDFDVYQFSKFDEDVPHTLDGFVEMDAEMYNGGEIIETEINGFRVLYYYSEEEFEGETYEVLTYTMEDNDEFIQIVFWLDGHHAEEDVQYIISSLDRQVWKTLPLGDSCYSIQIPFDYTEGYVDETDREEDGQVGYYYSPSALLDFDVYVFSNEDEDVADTLEAYMEDEADEYDGTNRRIEEVNGITVASYDAIEPSGDREFHTTNHLMEDGNNYVEIVFWRDGVVAEKQADAILATLAKSN